MPLRQMRIWRYVDEVARSGSIRQAAERLNLSASALQRRIDDLEDDLGTTLFERSPRGMRLSAAGEIFISWVRNQSADLERVRSQIEDLKGLRRGQIRIACSQGLVQSFLPREIARFRQQYPQVTFHVLVRDHGQAVQALINFEAELALAFCPPRHPDLQPLMSVGQRLVAIMAADHPLQATPVVRVRQCAAYPLALPGPSFGGRLLLDEILATSSMRFRIDLESNSFEMLRHFARETDAITFQFEMGALMDPPDPRLAVRPVDDRDLTHGPLVLAQLKQRVLPVATAKFAEHLARRLDAMRNTPRTGE